MNNSKNAEDQRLIARFVQFLQTTFMIANHETGDDPIDEIVRHDGYTFSIMFGGRRIYFKCSLEKP